MRKLLLTPFHSRYAIVRIIAYLIFGFSVTVPILCLGLIIFTLAALPSVFRNGCETVSSVEGFARIKLPPSATHSQVGCWGMQGVSAMAYFDMNPSDLEVFVNSTNVKLPLASTGKPARLECSTCNKLTSATSYLYGTYETHYDTDLWFEEIFIDTSNPSQYRVYFTLLAG